MSQRIWDKFLTERDRAVFAAGGFGARAGFGKRPALLVIDVNWAFCGERPEPILDSIKRWRTSCGEDSAVDQAAQDLRCSCRRRTHHSPDDDDEDQLVLQQSREPSSQPPLSGSGVALSHESTAQIRKRDNSEQSLSVRSLTIRAGRAGLISGPVMDGGSRCQIPAPSAHTELFRSTTTCFTSESRIRRSMA